MFNIIWLIVMFFLLASISAASGGYNASSGSDYRRKNSNKARKNSSTKSQRKYRERFDESDSFFDRNGDEHLLDDYGNCYDCDDQHDDI